MKNIVFGIILAFQFLTRIPMPISCPWTEQTIKWALRFYPIVGLVIGMLLNVVFQLEPYVPIWFISFLLLSVWIFITGGLHLDGWMDVADAVGSNAPLEKKWEIMKDSHIGSFAVISLLFLLVWKLAFLYGISENDSRVLPVALLAAPAMARWGALFLLFFVPAAKNEGLAWEWKKYLTYWDLVIATFPIVIAIFFYAVFAFIFLSLILFLFVYSIWVRSAFKGINGDLIGTAIEGGELWILTVVWSYTLFVMG
jgi:adenosylcobinamide-GDP ribazoletransferase